MRKQKKITSQARQKHLLLYYYGSGLDVATLGAYTAQDMIEVARGETIANMVDATMQAENISGSKNVSEAQKKYRSIISKLRGSDG